MIGNTITPVDGPIFRQVREDGFSSEYRVMVGPQRYTVVVKHTKEGRQTLGLDMDRHLISLKYTLLPGSNPDGSVRVPMECETYVVIRTPSLGEPAQAEAQIALLIDVLTLANTDGIISEVLNWES